VILKVSATTVAIFNLHTELQSYIMALYMYNGYCHLLLLVLINTQLEHASLKLATG